MTDKPKDETPDADGTVPPLDGRKSVPVTEPFLSNIMDPDHPQPMAETMSEPL
jgi:hypothetical protein